MASPRETLRCALTSSFVQHPQRDTRNIRAGRRDESLLPPASGAAAKSFSRCVVRFRTGVTGSREVMSLAGRPARSARALVPAQAQQPPQDAPHLRTTSYITATPAPYECRAAPSGAARTTSASRPSNHHPEHADRCYRHHKALWVHGEDLLDLTHRFFAYHVLGQRREAALRKPTGHRAPGTRTPRRPRLPAELADLAKRRNNVLRADGGARTNRRRRDRPRAPRSATPPVRGPGARTQGQGRTVNCPARTGPPPCRALWRSTVAWMLRRSTPNCHTLDLESNTCSRDAGLRKPWAS